MSENTPIMNDPFDKIPTNSKNIFSNEKLCIVDNEILKTEENINKNRNQEIREKFLKELKKIKDEYDKQNGFVKDETKAELSNLSIEAELSNLGVNIKKKKDKNGDEFNYVNLENINSDENLKIVLSIIKTNNHINQGLIRSIGEEDFKNILLKNTVISKNFDLIINDIFAIFCPDEKLLKELKIIVDGINDYEKNINILINKIPKENHEKAKLEINDIFKLKKGEGICTHSIVNEISRIFKENGGKDLKNEEIKNILQSGINTQIIKEEININSKLEEKLKKIGKNSINELSKEEIKKLFEDPELQENEKEELKKYISDKEKNEKIVKNFTEKDTYTALNTNKKTFQEYLEIGNGLSEIEAYVLRNYNLDLEKMDLKDIKNILKNYKKIKNQTEKDKQLIIILESYINIRKQKIENNKEIEEQIKNNKTKKENNISKNIQSNLDYTIPTNGKPSFINIEGSSDKMSITKIGDKYIVKIGESIEECNNEKELDNVIKAGKLLSQNGLSCIMGDIKNIMNILSKKFQFNFDAKDGFDNEEIKLFFAGVLHVLGEGKFEEIKTTSKDEIFKRFESFKYTNKTIKMKFEEAGIINKENSKFSIYEFEKKLNGIDSSKI